jgi:hypothetical protein
MMNHIKLFENFNRIIAYHGGYDIKDHFEYSHIGSAQHGTIYGQGFYFTSEQDMAKDFSAKCSKGYVYTVELTPKTPLTITEKELDKLVYSHLADDNNTEESFFTNIKNNHDCIIITNRKFGGNMKFHTLYENFTEYVVYDRAIINIIKKESW